MARAGRAAPAERVRPRRPAARQRHGGPGRAAPPGRLRRGLDSAADRAAAAHRVRPPELPAPLAPQLGPLARHLLRPGHLLVAGRAGQGSRALAGPVQLQEPAVRQDRLLPPVHDRGLEAAGRATGPAGRRASQEAAGVLQPALGVQPEPGGDPGAAGRLRSCRRYRTASPGGSSGPRPAREPRLIRRPPRRRRPGPGRSRPRRRAPWPRGQRRDQHPHPPRRRPRVRRGARCPPRPRCPRRSAWPVPDPCRSSARR